MKIECKPIGGQSTFDMIAFPGKRMWEVGDVKDCTPAEVDLLLGNPNFVIAATGKNPRFTCQTCGKPSFDEFFKFKGGHPIYLYEADGTRTCLDCFTNEQNTPMNGHVDEGVPEDAPAPTLEAARADR